MDTDDQPGPERSAAPAGDPRWKLTPTKLVVAVILAAAIVVPLLTTSYSRIEPRLFGFPFFYWYQFLWVFLAAACCAISYILLRREHRALRRLSDAEHGMGSGPSDGALGPDGKAE